MPKSIFMVTLGRSGLSLLVGCLLCACTATAPEKKRLTGEEAMALTKPLIDCEWHEAYRYDDGKSPISSVAEHIQAFCMGENIKVRLAFHVPINNPDLDLEDYKRIVATVERKRKNRER